MSLIWTDIEQDLLISLRPVLTTKEIIMVFKRLGFERSKEAIRKQSRRLSLNFCDEGYPINLKSNKIIEAVQSVLETTRPLLNVPVMSESPNEKAKKTKMEREIVRDLMSDLIDIRSVTPCYGSISLYVPKQSNKESLVVLLSDWHYGHTVYDSINQTKIFNTDIALQRIYNIAHLILSNFSNKEINQRFDECIVLLAGDMITGEGIFPGQEMITEEHAADQVKKCTKATWSFLKELRATFPLVRIVTTRGNHGRTGGSPEANWDNIIYQQLELLVDMEADNTLTIKNRYGLYNTFGVKGWRGHVRHIAPVQGDTGAASGKFTSWHMIHDWDLFCYGHYHHWGVFSINGKPVFRNGSLVGGDDYAEGLAHTDIATQLCWSVSETNPCVAIYPLVFE